MRARHEPEVPWGSFADALSGMLFVFVLTTFWFAWQLAQAKDAAEQQQKEAEERTRRILEADEQALALTRLRGTLTLCLRDAEVLDPRPQSGEPRISLYLTVKGTAVEWFQRGDATLRDQQLGAVDQIRRCVSDLLADESIRARYRVRVYLEGHTDSEPMRDPRESNWELSGRRAAAVVRRVVGDDGGGTAPRDQRIAEALAADDLEVMAVGMADLQPAWSRLCEEDLGPTDRRVCAALEDWTGRRHGPEADPAEQQLLGALEAALEGSFDHYCRPVEGPVRGNRPELLRRWANRCPDPDGDRGDGRRGLLRRVDLRLELLPRDLHQPLSAGAAP